MFIAIAATVTDNYPNTSILNKWQLNIT